MDNTTQIIRDAFGISDAQLERLRKGEGAAKWRNPIPTSHADGCIYQYAEDLFIWYVGRDGTQVGSKTLEAAKAARRAHEERVFVNEEGVYPQRVERFMAEDGSLHFTYEEAENAMERKDVLALLNEVDADLSEYEKICIADKLLAHYELRQK